jgi:hypothetical protein
MCDAFPTFKQISALIMSFLAVTILFFLFFYFHQSVIEMDEVYE